MGRATRTFSATVMSGSSAGCWWTMAMPSSAADNGVSCSTPVPSTSIVPLSGAIVPEATFISVDLPAPFSPSRAWTSPAATSRETSVSARTGPKRLEICVSTIRGCRVGTGSSGFDGEFEFGHFRVSVAGRANLDVRFRAEIRRSARNRLPGVC